MVEKINAIGTVEYNQSSKELIDAARTAYESFSKEEQALFPVASNENAENAESAQNVENSESAESIENAESSNDEKEE